MTAGALLWTDGVKGCTYFKYRYTFSAVRCLTVDRPLIWTSALENRVFSSSVHECLYINVGMTKRQTGRERDGSSSEGQCEPREKARDHSGAQMYSVPEVIRAVT